MSRGMAPSTPPRRGPRLALSSSTRWPSGCAATFALSASLAACGPTEVDPPISTLDGRGDLAPDIRREDVEPLDPRLDSDRDGIIDVDELIGWEIRVDAKGLSTVAGTSLGTTTSMAATYSAMIELGLIIEVVYELHGALWELVAVFESEAGYEGGSVASVALDWPDVFASWAELDTIPGTSRLRRFTFRCEGDCPALTGPDADAGSAMDTGSIADAGRVDVGPTDAGSDGGGLDAMDGRDGADTDLVDRVVLACHARPGRTSAGHAWCFAAIALLAAWRRRARPGA